MLSLADDPGVVGVPGMLPSKPDIPSQAREKYQTQALATGRKYFLMHQSINNYIIFGCTSLAVNELFNTGIPAGMPPNLVLTN